MGTLSSELGPHLERLVERPRVYADANIPSGVVSYMRVSLGWDVLFVLEHDDLRRAPDIEHYRLARQLGRTLVTLDRDYTDDRRFPPAESPGVIVFSAPDERWLRKLLKQADRTVFRAESACRGPSRGGSCSGRSMIFLADADVVLPDRVMSRGDRGRRRAIASSTCCRMLRRDRRAICTSISGTTRSCRASSTCTSTASKGPIRSTARPRLTRIASRLPRYGVTAFCPTSVACAPDDLRTMLTAVAGPRDRPAPRLRLACCPRTSKATSSIRSIAARSRSSASACRVAPTQHRGPRASSPARKSWPRSRRRGPTWAS